MVGFVTVCGLVLGIVIGILRPVHIPAVYSKYVGLALLAGMDSILGGIKGYLKDTFDATVFFSGFLINSLVAALLGISVISWASIFTLRQSLCLEAECTRISQLSGAFS